MGKRFMLDDAGELIDLDNHKFVGYGEECCDLLNSLSEKQRITNMTNQALIRFIKSKGYSLKEVLEFVNEL